MHVCCYLSSVGELPEHCHCARLSHDGARARARGKSASKAYLITVCNDKESQIILLTQAE